MTPTTPATTLTVTKSVFDLDTFSKVKLEKTIPEPSAPTSVEEALSAAGNDTAAFLRIFHNGLIESAKETAAASTDGFYAVSDEDEDETEKTPYTGRSATPEQGENIKQFLAKLNQAQGLVKSTPPARKKEIKANVIAFVKANPALIQMLLGPAQPEAK